MPDGMYLKTAVFPDPCARRLCGRRRALPSDVPAVATLLLPGVPPIVGVTSDGRVVGWFQRCGSRVQCVVHTKEPAPVVRLLPGLREAVALLRETGAVSLEYVSKDTARLESFSDFDQAIPERSGS